MKMSKKATALKAAYLRDLEDLKNDEGRMASLGIGREVILQGHTGVVYSNDVCLVNGYPNQVPGVLVHESNGLIYVNEAWFELTPESQHATLAHERGHIECGHLQIGEAELLRLHCDRSNGIIVEAIQLEYEADAYAMAVGTDMLGAIEELKSIFNQFGIDKNNTELDMRKLRIRQAE